VHGDAADVSLSALLALPGVDARSYVETQPL
jgi:hypothetical protein